MSKTLVLRDPLLEIDEHSQELTESVNVSRDAVNAVLSPLKRLILHINVLRAELNLCFSKFKLKRCEARLSQIRCQNAEKRIESQLLRDKEHQERYSEIGINDDERLLTTKDLRELSKLIPFWTKVKYTDFVPTTDECVRNNRVFLKMIQPDEEYSAGDRRLHQNSFFDTITYMLKLFEVKTHELLDGLSDHLIETAGKIKKPNGEPVTVVEIGAGDGKLAHCLQEYCDQKYINGETNFQINIFATDNGKDEYEPIFEVERFDNEEALKEFEPDIVINSWMPLEVDFSAEWRKHVNIKEYILIGEGGGGCTGAEDTYGWYGPNNPKNNEWNQKLKRDGFTVEWLDIPTFSRTGNTGLTSFKRKREAGRKEKGIRN